MYELQELINNVKGSGSRISLSIDPKPVVYLPQLLIFVIILKYKNISCFKLIVENNGRIHNGPTHAVRACYTAQNTVCPMHTSYR